MKIGIEAYPLARKFAGISVYLYNILKYLHKYNTEQNQYFLYAPDSDSLKLPFAPNKTWQLTRNKGFLNNSATLWMQLKAKGVIKKNEIEIFWAPEAILPLNLPSQVKTILTVHDLTCYRYPATLKWDNKLIFPLLFKKSLFKAEQIVTDSESVALEIKEHFPQLSKKIKCVYPGIDTAEFKAYPKDESKQYISKKFQTSQNYILSVSTLEPRKNMENLLKGYTLFKKNYPELNYQLLIAGGKGWKDSTIHKTYTDLNLSETEVKFLNYVPQEDMAKLYSGAALFTFPSHYEGFGFTPLEAMACGTPTVASNIPVLKETLGEAAIFVDPLNIEEIAQSIALVLSDQKQSEKLISKGLERIPLFSWEKTAKIFLEELFTRE